MGILKVFDGTSFVEVTGASGDVVGPGSSTDNALPRFDGVGGKTLQNSGIIVDDSDNMSGVTSLDLGTVSMDASSDVLTVRGDTAGSEDVTLDFATGSNVLGIASTTGLNHIDAVLLNAGGFAGLTIRNNSTTSGTEAFLHLAATTAGSGFFGARLTHSRDQTLDISVTSGGSENVVARFLGANGNLRITGDLLDEDDTDTGLILSGGADIVSLQAGGVPMIKAVETTQNLITIGIGDGSTDDVDTVIEDGSGTAVLQIFGGPGSIRIGAAAKALGFFASGGTVKQTVTGSRAGNAALASLLSIVAGHGLVVDGTVI